MWAFPVVTWAFQSQLGMPTSPTSQLGMPMSQRECDWECPHIPYMLGMGTTTTSIYGKAMVVPSWGGNDHPYYVWKVWSFPFLQLGMTILAIYGSSMVLPIPSVGNGHYCHIWKVWKAWVAQLELLSVELVNLSQQSSWLLDYPLDPAVQQKWSPFAREYTGGAMDCSLIPPSVLAGLSRYIHPLKSDASECMSSKAIELGV
ncbi:hypothetical protein B0H14DRAFT_2564960 [Mycena olivaceomarginata]|nr:hypothetical protein B0H14DRAFT_2564960 [Mycena olivaceomarginata]